MRLGTLQPRVDTVKGKVAESWREDKRNSHQRGYDWQWRKDRAAFLVEHPLCVMCQAEAPPRVTVATVVDHVVPHRGSKALFRDHNNWQSLCAAHHAIKTARGE